MKIFSTVRNFLENTSLHGFKFIAEPGRHWSERLLWTIVCVISWIGSAMLFQTSYIAFQEKAVSFVVETTYLEANTSYPSVSICEDENVQPLYDAANALFGEDHDNNLDEVLRELAYFRGSAYYIKGVCSELGSQCPRGNFSELVRQVRVNCEEILSDCSWTGKPFDCCKHFVPIETELGTCFSFSRKNENKLKERGEPDWVDTIANRHKPLPSLKFEINGSVRVFLHSEYDVPYLNSLSPDILQPDEDMVKYYYITVTDMENPPEVRQLSINQRKCRFPDENNLKTTDFYSYSSCIVDCRRRAQMELCNCTSHFTPKSKPEEHCDYDGIICLDSFNTRLAIQKTKWGDKEGLICDCLPGCADTDFDVVVTTQESMDPETGTSIVVIKLLRFPTERYKRNVVRGLLDLVVSMGSAAALFVGASLLTIVEVAYYFLIRSRTTERLDATAHDATQSQNEDEESSNENNVQGILPFVF